MRLKAAQITNFRCVEDSDKFSIGDVTCLVGKNESGKTSILQALERLNPYDEALKSYDKSKDYPRRHLPKYDQRHPDGKAIVANTEWKLEPNDIELLQQELGADCLSTDMISISKGF